MTKLFSCFMCPGRKAGCPRSCKDASGAGNQVTPPAFLSILADIESTPFAVGVVGMGLKGTTLEVKISDETC